jgi:hypothetical protein
VIASLAAATDGTGDNLGQRLPGEQDDLDVRQTDTGDPVRTLDDRGRLDRRAADSVDRLVR